MQQQAKHDVCIRNIKEKLSMVYMRWHRQKYGREKQSATDKQDAAMVSA